MQFRPLHDRVVARRVEVDETERLITREADSMAVIEQYRRQIRAA